MAFAGRIGPLNRWLLACLAVCVGIGVLAGINPEYGLVGALGVMLAVITIMDLTLGFVLFTICVVPRSDQQHRLVLRDQGGRAGAVRVLACADRNPPRHRDRVVLAAENPCSPSSLVAMLGWAALELCVGVQPQHGAGRGRPLRARHDAAADRLRRDARTARRASGCSRPTSPGRRYPPCTASPPRRLPGSADA